MTIAPTIDLAALPLIEVESIRQAAQVELVTRWHQYKHWPDTFRRDLLNMPDADVDTIIHLLAQDDDLAALRRIAHGERNRRRMMEHGDVPPTSTARATVLPTMYTAWVRRTGGRWKPVTTGVSEAEAVQAIQAEAQHLQHADTLVLPMGRLPWQRYGLRSYRRPR